MTDTDLKAIRDALDRGAVFGPDYTRALCDELERLRARLGLAEAVLDRCWDISGAPGLCAALDAWRAAKEADGE